MHPAKYALTNGSQLKGINISKSQRKRNKE
jgi:hypothetical protein